MPEKGTPPRNDVSLLLFTSMIDDPLNILLNYSKIMKELWMYFFSYLQWGVWESGSFGEGKKQHKLAKQTMSFATRNEEHFACMVAVGLV